RALRASGAVTFSKRMLTLGWFEEVTRGSNWKFRFDWRARLRMASVNGTSSITIKGTTSSGLVAAGALAAAPAAFSRAATGVALSAGPAGGGAAGAAGDST